MEFKKLSAGMIISIFLVFVIGASMFPAVTSAIGSATERVFSVSSDSQFTEGTLTNLTASDGLKLESAETSGTYVSHIYETTGTDWNDSVIQATISNPTNSSVTATVEFSNDGFSSVADSTQETLSDGSNSIDLSAYSYSDVRVQLDFSREDTGTTTPEVNSFEVTGTSGGTSSLLLGLVGTLFVLGIVGYGARQFTGM